VKLQGGGDPRAFVLAAEAGHADIVRYLLDKWPKAGTDEAFSVADVRDDVCIAKMLRCRSKFIWGPRSWHVLWKQPDERVARLLSEHRFGQDAVVGICESGQENLGVPSSRLELLLRVEHATRELAESMLGHHRGFWGGVCGLARDWRVYFSPFVQRLGASNGWCPARRLMILSAAMRRTRSCGCD
jgi:hypothetical protein